MLDPWASLWIKWSQWVQHQHPKPWEVKGQGHNPLIRNILKTVTDTRLNPPPRKHWYIGPMGFRLAPSDFTLDDLKGSKNQGHTFWHEIVNNGESHDVVPWASLWMTLRGYKVNISIIWSEISCEQWQDFFESSHGLWLASQIWPWMTLRGKKPKWGTENASTEDASTGGWNTQGRKTQVRMCSVGRQKYESAGVENASTNTYLSAETIIQLASVIKLTFYSTQRHPKSKQAIKSEKIRTVPQLIVKLDSSRYGTSTHRTTRIGGNVCVDTLLTKSCMSTR